MPKAKVGEGLEYRFRKTGVNGLENSFKNFEKFVALRKQTIKKAEEFYKVAFPEEHKKGFYVCDVDVKDVFTTNPKAVAVIKDPNVKEKGPNSYQKIDIPGGALFTSNIKKYYQDIVKATKAEENRLAREAEKKKFVEKHNVITKVDNTPSSTCILSKQDLETIVSMLAKELKINKR